MKVLIESMSFGGTAQSCTGYYHGKRSFDVLTHAESVLPSPLDSAIALIIGAVDAPGSAIAKRFSCEGFAIAAVRCDAEKLAPLADTISVDGHESHAFGIDARTEEQVDSLFPHIEAGIGEIDVMVFTIGANVQLSIVETTAQKYYKVWEMGSFTGFLTGREAARTMLPRKRGAIIFTGATQSVRGGTGFSAFSGAKNGLRDLAQNIARELGPEDIHLGHLVIDGSIDTEFIRTLFPERYKPKEIDGILNPAHNA
ncbi:SDR family NAD(P)-dependent oxidoreductase [Paraburkholderia sp. GAS348]|uniref:SDR family NAD(P)-dependent oxidoreductase n=1 Tax=Paraburkholderia sp. GAS348 TaxID=3035132 RepID=UPI003D1C1B92